MFNRSKSSPVPVVPIDEDEQDKIAAELKQQAAGQTLTIRTIFQYIFLVVVLILFICLMYSVFSPWEMEHQKVFLDIVPIYGFFSYYVGSMYCYTICAYIVKVRPYIVCCTVWVSYCVIICHSNCRITVRK